MKTGFISPEELLSDFLSMMDLTEEELDTELLHIWINDGVSMVSTTEQLVHKIDILTVEDFKAKKPDDFNMLCEISYRLDKPKSCKNRRIELTKFAQKTAEGCELEMSIKCPDCHKTSCSGCGQSAVVVEVDRMWEMANSHYYYPTRFMSGNGVQTFGRGDKTSVYSDKFLLMRPATSDWFQINKHIPDCVNAHCKECSQTYMIEDPNIEVSFEKGEILIAYLATPVDSSGNRLVPNHRDAIEAVTNYLIFKWLKRYYLKNRQEPNAYRDFKSAEQDLDVSVGRARSALQIPSIREFNEWLSQNRMFKIDSAYDNLIHGRRPTVDRLGNIDKYRN